MTAILRYFGGKVLMARKIIGLFPSHDAYIEPYAGGAAVLLAKPRCKLEVYNDLDGDVVNLFRVLREHRDALAEAVALTPFARAEHELAYQPCSNPIERARRTLIRSHFGFGSNGIHKPTGFRAAGLRSGLLPVHNWTTIPDAIKETAERLRGVVIENRPALQVMATHDSPTALFYVDPPYLHDTRDRTSRYEHEMTGEEHGAMLQALLGLKGRVILSGYASPLYDDALTGWRRIELKAHADGKRDRVEVLWCNFADRLALQGEQTT
jgi:DNA adenine methylase